MSKISPHVFQPEHLPQTFRDEKLYNETKTSLEAALSGTHHLALMLPGAHQSPESYMFKNVVFTIAGSEKPPSTFHCDWNHGVTGVRLPDDVSRKFFDMDVESRQAMIQNLVSNIPNELYQKGATVGPCFGESASTYDAEPWKVGFGSANECVGLYESEEIRTADTDMRGIDRARRTLYLVVKSGCGRASREFHVRFEQKIREGTCLNDISMLEDDVRRLQHLTRRYRLRFLYVAAKILGFHNDIQTVSDDKAHDNDSAYRLVVPDFDVHTNVIRKEDNVWKYYAGSIDGSASEGIVCVSNVSDGLVLFRKSINDELGAHVQNGCHNSVPFGSVRFRTTLDTYTDVVGQSTQIHPYDSWVRSHMGYIHVNDTIDVLPAQLWGTHDRITWVSHPSSDLSLHEFQPERLRPFLVAIAGTEQKILRKVIKSIRRREHKDEDDD